MISSKQVGFIDMIQKLCTESAAEVEESYNANKERILANVAKQKADLEAEEKAAEEKRLRKE